MTNPIPENERTEIEAAAFRRLVAHLRERTDVQNIDLMNLAGFCRNCLSKWYLAAAEELLETGEFARNDQLPAGEVAALTTVASTIMNFDATIILR